jgi:hypothetical protein
MPKPANEFRIVCIGGSTTYDDCIDDDAGTYPARLQFHLTQRGYAVKVINAGVPGWTSYESVINFALRISSIAPDLIIDYDGWNDLSARVVRPETYASDNSAVKSGAFPSFPWYEQLTLVHILLLLKGAKEVAPTRSQAWGMMNKPTENFLSFPGDPFFQQMTLTDLLKRNPPDFFRPKFQRIIPPFHS